MTTLRYTYPGRRGGEVEVQPATTAKYIAKRVAAAVGADEGMPWSLVAVDGPMRPGRAFRALLIHDDALAADLDPSQMYSIAEVTK